MTQASSTASVGGLVRGAIDDVRELFREELSLAKAEIREEISKVASGGTRMGMACAALWFGALFVLVAAALGLSAALQLPAWAGFGIMGVVLALIGVVMGLAARNSLREVRTLPRTVGTIKETFQ